MDIGDTFHFGNTEYAIKKIVYEEKRIDASKFIGENISCGRPVRFDYDTIAEILGEPTVRSPVKSDLPIQDRLALANWRRERANPENVKALIDEFKHEKNIIC